jgi:hypothetical protein
MSAIVTHRLPGAERFVPNDWAWQTGKVGDRRFRQR